MKLAKTFLDFYTQFLQLARQAKIPSDNLQLDLFNKLTLELQRTVLLVYTTLSTEKALTDQYVALNNRLQQIRTHSNQVKACIALLGALLIKPLSVSAIPSWTTLREPTPSRYTQEATLDYTTYLQTRDIKPPTAN